MDCFVSKTRFNVTIVLSHQEVIIIYIEFFQRRYIQKKRGRISRSTFINEY